MSPEEVCELKEYSHQSADEVNAISFFQTAVLDPIKMMEKIEKLLGVALIATKTAMFWYLLSRVHLACPLQGYGRLLPQPLKLGS